MSKLTKVNVTKHLNFVETYKNAGEVDGRNVTSRIMKVKVPNQSYFYLRSDQGVIAKLRDTDNEEIGGNSQIVFGADKENYLLAKQVSESIPYSLLKEMDINDQSDRQKNSRTRIQLLEGKNEIMFSPGDNIIIFVNSEDQVDWDNTLFQFPIWEEEK
ncbi:MAG: hypothetical protein ACOCRX_03255 [Candidatus Woesearchaeota archaeon]